MRIWNFPTVTFLFRSHFENLILKIISDHHSWSTFSRNKGLPDFDLKMWTILVRYIDVGDIYSRYLVLLTNWSFWWPIWHASHRFLLRQSHRQTKKGRSNDESVTKILKLPSRSHQHSIVTNINFNKSANIL